MLLALMLLAAQDVPRGQDAPPEEKPRTATATAPEGTQSWSILADPCASVTGDPAKDEIVVCGSTAATSPRLPLPAERGPPDRPMPSNPYMTGTGALAATAAPCATLSEGCTVGIDLFGGGTALIRLIGKVADPDSCCERPGEATNPVGLVGDMIQGVGGLFKRKPDKRGRVAIPLDGTPIDWDAARAAAPKPEKD